ncbi:hypothetical protein Taro_009973 [Colocasia esculenta]|uniref:Uncharacterized protein n=1 Tax=Colocasia esculenta TaxID=4460 RepID=A0A843U5N6_COLES|nr:hypothetical protein [Colocasia esculenta]
MGVHRYCRLPLMHDLGMEPSPHTFDGFVRAVISERGLTYAMRVAPPCPDHTIKAREAER